MSRREADAAARQARIEDWKNRLVWLAIATAVLVAAVLFRLQEGTRPASAAPAAANASQPADGQAPLPQVGPPQHDVMAIVNGKDVSRRALIDACIVRHGEDVLESMVNKRLIMSHCANRGIEVTNEEITAEIDRVAKGLQLGREQFLELIKKERGVSPQEYARDIVWPLLAMRELAAAQLTVSPEEIEKAYEAEYGPMVRCRLIAMSDEAKARHLRDQLAAHPEAFARAAIESSEDVNSASLGGLIQPIRRHVGDPGLEEAAFALQPGQVSPVVKVAEHFIILKCEETLAPRNVPLAEIQNRLVDRIKDEKLRMAAHELFGQLQSTATIQNVYNNPQLRETMPDVVATVNGDRITMQELAVECLARHGEEVLEVEISQLLLTQSLEAASLTVTQEDINSEIAHAAELGGVVDQQGRADLKKWIEMVKTEQGVSEQQYIRDAVWPSAALKKLTAQEVKVDEEDIRKGFEANYGERVRCRAIVLGTMRRAQEVWDKARKNPSPDYFGDLATEYSIEPQSKALRGEVPPLGRHGGQPQLEAAAFALQDGQLSGVIQVGDKFIILRCEGRTERLDVDENTVRDILYRDIFEKKLRMAMSAKFEKIRAQSRVDNYLAGTSHEPEKPAVGRQAGVRQDTAVQPTAGAR